MTGDENTGISIGTAGKPLYGCFGVVGTAVVIVLAIGFMCLKGCIL